LAHGDNTMTERFMRDHVTWLAYVMLAIYGYYLNAFGPITPFLKEELHLSYTVSSLHFSAFAAGILLVGLGGHWVVNRIGSWSVLWGAVFGLSAGTGLLVLGKNPVITITASLLMGLIGSFILVIVPSSLADRHGEQRSIALSEANTLASLVSALAPLMVGWFARSAAGWRMGLIVTACLPPVLWLAFGKSKPVQVERSTKYLMNEKRRLPSLFWIYWAAVVLVVSVEFCMIFWSANYLESEIGLGKASAAQSVSLFLGAMILGRLAGSRLVQRIQVHRLVAASILLATAGFWLFWTAHTPLLSQAGLFITGFGVAPLYPLCLSLAIGSAGEQTVLASARTTLASGSAILLLPLVLGRLADSFGIRPAYALVLGLLACALGVILATSWRVHAVAGE
jgi:fucose permease